MFTSWVNVLCNVSNNSFLGGGGRINQRGFVNFWIVQGLGEGGGLLIESGVLITGIVVFRHLLSLPEISLKEDRRKCLIKTRLLLRGIFLAQRSCRKNKEKAGCRAPKRPGRK